MGMKGIMISIYIKVKAEKFVGIQGEDNTWTYAGSYLNDFGKDEVTFDEIDQESNNYLDNLIKEYGPVEVIERQCHSECRLHQWYVKSQAQPERLQVIEAVYSSHIAGSSKIKFGFDKVFKSALVRLKKNNLLKVCPRCGGTGQHSYNPKDGTTCFKCGGFKYVLPKVSQKWLEMVEKTFKKPIEEKTNISYNNINETKEEGKPKGDVDMKLTTMEIKILNAMRTNEYNDAIDWPTWTFTAISNSGIDAKQARGVISSLVKKGLVEVTPSTACDDEETIGYTDEGKKLFDNADGKENTGWGGPNLLKDPDDEIKEEPEMNNTKDIKEMKLKELQQLAKEMKVKNWWTLKNKASLIEAIESLNKPQKVEPEKKPENKEPEKVENKENNEPEEKEDDEDRQSTKGMDKEGITTLQDILDQIKKENKKEIRGMKARRLLRNSDVERPFKKWEWDTKKHKKIIDQVKKILMK